MNVAEQLLRLKTDIDEVYAAGQKAGGDYDSAYQDGYTKGHTAGETEGYGKGYTDGQTDGYDSGYDVGFEDGKATGYDQDFIDAIFGGSLTEIRIESITIAEHGCRGRVQLIKVILPKVTTFQSYAFYNCSKLATIIIETNSVATLKNVNVFTNTPIANGIGYIYVPANLVESYKTASNWSTYADQIRAIEDYPDILNSIET